MQRRDEIASILADTDSCLRSISSSGSTKRSAAGRLQSRSSSVLPSRESAKALQSRERRLDRLREAWVTSLDYDENNIIMPKHLLFHDVSCRKPLKTIDLSGWRLNHEAFRLLATPSFENLSVLLLDHVTAFDVDHFRYLRGHKGIRRLSLVGMKIEVDREVDEIIGSMRSLVHLNLSECTIHNEKTSLLIMSQCLAALKTLLFAKSKGVDNYVLNNMAQCIERFRTLHTLDLSYCQDFTDEGLLALIQASGSIVTNISIHHCRQLTTLSLASLRNKMSALHSLNISHLLIGPTAYEWITEGCRSLVSLNLTKASDLNDELLGKIGRWCRHLQHLNISYCLQLSDAGIVQLFNRFDGALRSLDLTGCVACTDISLTAIIQHDATIQAMESLKLNGLSQISASKLKIFWDKVLVEGNLQQFEMSCALKSTSSHRRSMMPHFSDEVLTSLPAGFQRNGTASHQAISRKLTSLKLVGAGQISDVGLHPFLKQAGETLQFLDVSYCHKVTDASLQIMAQCCRVLSSLILTGCIYITDAGLVVLCKGDFYGDMMDDVIPPEGTVSGSIPSTLSGSSSFKSQYLPQGKKASQTSIVGKSISIASSLCRRSLRTLELNGCGKLTDVGLRAIASGLRHRLQTLGIRSCDLITNKGILSLARFCYDSLHSLDMLNLDYVTSAAVSKLVARCRLLTVLNCDGCAFTAHEFARTVTRETNSILDPQRGGKGLFFSKSSGQCRLEPLPLPVVKNHDFLLRYVLPRERAAVILQGFARYIERGEDVRRKRAKSKGDLWRMRRIFRYFQLGIRKSHYEHMFSDRLHAVRVLQVQLPRLYAVHLARKLLAHKRRVLRSTCLLQRIYRGHRCRRRQRKLFQRLFYFYNLIGHIAHKYHVIHHARRLHRFILATQAFARMVPPRARFWTIRRGVCLLQRRVRLLQNYKLRQQLQRERLAQAAILLQAKRDAAASFLQRNLRAGLFNRSMAPFIFMCCIYYRNDYDEKMWASLLFQKRWRGYIVRLKKYRAWLRATNAEGASIRIQATWRRYHQHRIIFPPSLATYRRVMVHYHQLSQRWKPRLRLGRLHVRPLQRWYRRYTLIHTRNAAATVIQCAFRCHTARLELHRRYLNYLEHCADVLKRCFRKWHWKLFRRAMRHRQHMAAYRIYVSYDLVVNAILTFI